MERRIFYRILILGEIPLILTIWHRWTIGFGVEIVSWSHRRIIEIYLPLITIKLNLHLFYSTYHRYLVTNWWQILVAAFSGGTFYSRGVGFTTKEAGEHYNWLFGNSLRLPSPFPLVADESDDEDEDPGNYEGA